ncbi:MAG: ChbG/HpnK family deacetylase, partial [Chloroflexota bacterium]|nr:ChbG/HpnK family deacetylase [Chloroflexota bacterium]
MEGRGLLIVTGDDVGHDAEATDRTLECFEAGRITSASAIVHMKDSERASGLLKAAGIRPGLHINLSEAYTDPATPATERARQARLVRRFG